MTTSEILTSIGFFLTLVGLLGTFFYIHLSNWFRDILELQSKFKENEVGDQDYRRHAIVECKYQLKRVLNHVPLLVSIIISSFIIVLTTMAWNMINYLDPRPLIFSYYESAIMWFLVAYFSLTLYFLIHGYSIAYILRKKLFKKSENK